MPACPRVPCAAVKFASLLVLVAVVAVAAVSAPPAGGEAEHAGIRVPRGFTASVYARGLERPTALAFGPDRRLYVAQETGAVVSIATHGARARVFASGFRTPLGLAWRGRTLFVSSQGSLDAVPHAAPSRRRRLVANLPYGRHQQNQVVIGRGGRLYFGSGSTCDVCVERDRRSAAILSVRPDGSGLRVEATGLRNPFGLAVEPRTGRIFVSVNNRDDLGTWEPAETIVVLRRGARYGWPDCWPSWRRRQLVGSCRGVTRPLAYLEPHSSPNGMAFAAGRAFPRAYRGKLIVAEWGQYYSRRFGRKLVSVDPRTGRARLFADGFDHPLAVAASRSGGLFVADWGRGVIYRIQARRNA